MGRVHDIMLEEMEKREATNTSKTYRVDMSKVNTLEDVKIVLGVLSSSIVMTEDSSMYEKMKPYLK